VWIKLSQWKRLRQRLCNIQIHVYFANTNSTILYIISYDMVSSEYRFVYRVSPQLLNFCNVSLVITIMCTGSRILGSTPSSGMNFYSQIASVATSAVAVYSDSIVDLAFSDYLQLLQLTALPLTKNTYPI
jgi:hypothetical protein